MTNDDSPSNDSTNEQYSDITLPRLSVDDKATLDERLTDNVQDRIGPQRYFSTDATGDLVENSWDEVFRRVAENLAVGEAVHHESPIEIPPAALADWVDEETEAGLFGDEEYVELDDSLGSYVSYENLVDFLEGVGGVVADDIIESMETAADDFEQNMRTQQFMPNSPTLMNAGTEVQQLSACFVNSPEDTIEDICLTETEWTLVQKTGGGMGGAFHKLRPKGDPISTTGGVSSGPLSFMSKFDKVAGVIKQGGKRRGAQMGIMHCEHPDIGRFCVAKRGESEFTNFNISVGVSDQFRNAVQQDGTYTLSFPVDAGEPYEVTPEVAHFYDPRFEDAWNDDLDKAGTGHDGKVVEENFWRDYWQDMQDPAAFEEYRDQLSRETATIQSKSDTESTEVTAGDVVPLDGGETYTLESGDTIVQQFGEVEVPEDGSISVSDGDEVVVEEAEVSLEPGEPMELPAGFIFQLMVDGAHNNGEPGFYYYDETQREHSFDTEVNSEYEVYATNPCAEQPLMEYEACNLGHVNLSLLVEEDAPLWDDYITQELPDFDDFHRDELAQDFLDEALDNEQLEEVVTTATRFLDNVVTMSKFPLDKIDDRVTQMRKVGLGVMGFHQMLLQLGVQYNSKASYAIAREIMRRIDLHGTRTSHQLAQERGTFEAYEDSKWADPTEYPEWTMKHAHIDPYEYEDGYEIRNHNITTVAPTGTTSMIGDTSAGCEPIYSVAFFKNVGDDIQGDSMLVEFDDYFLRTLEHNGIDVDQVKAEAEEQMMNNEWDGVPGLSAVPDEVGDLFVTTDGIDVEDHIYVQSAFQDFCDSGISKTLNLQNEATLEDVADTYSLAMDEGIKGSTIYRDGSRDEQVKTTRADNGLDDKQELLDELDVEELVDELESREDNLEVVEAEERAVASVQGD